MSKPSQERRKHVRIQRNFILTYHEKGKTAQRQQHSQVNNISKGGINFSAHHPLPEGATLVISLKTPFIADAIHLEGVVLGCKEKVSGMIYEIRLQFHGLSQHSLAVLEKVENYGIRKESS